VKKKVPAPATTRTKPRIGLIEAEEVNEGSKTLFVGLFGFTWTSMAESAGNRFKRS
jgi:hypothetical protein